MTELIEVTVKVHPANLERIKRQAEMWQEDVASVDQELWEAAHAISGGDDEEARFLLESPSITFGWRRLIDVARSGPEGLRQVHDYLGRIRHGIYT